MGEINGVPYIKFIAPGIIASSAMFAATYECTYGTYVRMTFQKTFDAILATPVNINDLIAGELIWGATKEPALWHNNINSRLSVGLIDSSIIIFAIPILFVAGLIFAEIALIFVAIVPGIESFNYFYHTFYDTHVFIFRDILST